MSKQTRRWHDEDVDIELKDEWLRDLNRLRAFELISICAGHHDRKADRCPHINFRAKPSIRRKFVSDWNKLIRPVLGRVGDAFQFAGTTDVQLCLRAGWRAKSRYTWYEEDIVLLIECGHARRSAVMGPQFVEWFKMIICLMKEFDSQIYGFLNRRRVSKRVFSSAKKRP